MKVLIDFDLVDIENTQYDEMIKKNTNKISKCVQACLKQENITIKQAQLYIRFTNNKEIKKINKKFRNIDKETDVLSFPIYENYEIREDNINKMPVVFLGDIIISIEKIMKQAQEYEHSFERELFYLITHATLHLLGYDHIKNIEKKNMRQKEENIMEVLKISR